MAGSGDGRNSAGRERTTAIAAGLLGFGLALHLSPPAPPAKPLDSATIAPAGAGAQERLREVGLSPRSASAPRRAEGGVRRRVAGRRGRA